MTLLGDRAELVLAPCIWLEVSVRGNLLLRARKHYASFAGVCVMRHNPLDVRLPYQIGLAIALYLINCGSEGRTEIISSAS